MKATLRYTLPEEHEELTAALQAMAMREVLRELDDGLRNELKYRDPPEVRATAFEEIRAMLSRLLEGAGVRLWD